MGVLTSIDALGDFYDVADSLGTGYAVASSKRNAEFHAVFKNISEDDYLIEGTSSRPPLLLKCEEVLMRW